MRRVELKDLQAIEWDERIKVSCVYYTRGEESEERRKEMLFRDVDRESTCYLLGEKEVQSFDSVHKYRTLGGLIEGMWEDLEKFVEIVRFEFFDFGYAEAFYVRNEAFKI